MSSSDGSSDGFDQRLRQRSFQRTNGLETVPLVDIPQPHGRIPNSPLAASTISFLLGSTFAIGLFTSISGGFDRFWWSTYQLGFFVAAWAAFHWGEFAVTAGWNREKCSVDCTFHYSSRRSRTLTCRFHVAFLLDNGAMYHIANGIALSEYLLTLYFLPSAKTYPYVSLVGE